MATVSSLRFIEAGSPRLPAFRQLNTGNFPSRKRPATNAFTSHCFSPAPRWALMIFRGVSAALMEAAAARDKKIALIFIFQFFFCLYCVQEVEFRQAGYGISPSGGITRPIQGQHRMHRPTHAPYSAFPIALLCRLPKHVRQPKPYSLAADYELPRKEMTSH